jgi:hypothetical protein
MTFRDMPRHERLSQIGGLVSDTPAFLAASQIVRTCYDNWRTQVEGTCSFVVGDTGAGKTTVADEFLIGLARELGGVASLGSSEIASSGHEMPPSWSVTIKTDTGIIRPVMKVFIAPQPRFIALMSDFLRQMGVGTRARPTMGELITLAVHHAHKQQLRLVIFDESQHVVEQRISYEAADVFKHLMNLARVQIVGMGMPHALDIPDVNGQVGRRTVERHEIPPFACTPDDPKSAYMRFAATVEAELPFDAPSGLNQPDLALRMHLATAGYVGRYMPLVHAAATRAIDDGRSHLSRTLLGEAYRAKEGVDDAENPFLMGDPDPERFKAIRMRILARKAAAAEGSRGGSGHGRPRVPDFTK